MKKCAFHTLGCKVNQYDTQAMLECFEAAGYKVVSFHEEADIYLINTCTVTGTGDSKSVKLIRRTAREHPNASIIVAGCLAQRDAARVSLDGVMLVLGVKYRSKVVELFERAMRENERVIAVDDEDAWTFEKLTVTRHDERTRATMKIQEGCDRYCAYCIIPSVRGPVRSMPLEEVKKEAQRLADAGYREIVLTGIHLASYGHCMDISLLDAIRAVHEIDDVLRIRLGSLEPLIVTDQWIGEMKTLKKVCPQFHLSMQSGSGGVLHRMRRRYSPEQYFDAVLKLKSAFPGCALTTDVLTGFPGEMDEEAHETLDFIRRVGFARIHVFPYSRRSGTVADAMPMQVPEHIKQKRAAELISLGNQLEKRFVKKQEGSVQAVLFEEAAQDGLCEGYTANYVRVRAAAEIGDFQKVRILRAEKTIAYGEVYRP